MPTITFKAGGFERQLDRFLKQLGNPSEVEAVVRPILAEVRERGDAAILEFTERFDGARLAPRDLRVSEADLAAASGALSAAERRAVAEAIRSVRDFHKRTRPEDWSDRNRQGGVIGERFYPIRRVGLYVPGGQVPLLSTVLMTVIPAQIAGVVDMMVCTPPGRDGGVDPKLLAVLSICGVSEVYRIGGAQAIAAMAHGTRTVAPVDKVFGPGNAYVMEAKRQVFGVVGVDLLPGPSEVMVIADGGARPDWVAADLIAQAEHGTGKERIYLAALSKEFLSAVDAAIVGLSADLPNAATVRTILKQRRLSILCADLDEAAEAANRIAPEHLELQVAPRAFRKLEKAITTAGALLEGYHTPTVLGDFTAGPSHTLPTGGAARFSSGLQVIDFMRRTSVVRYDADAARKALPVVEVFGASEHLEGHAQSLRMRCGDDRRGGR